MFAIRTASSTISPKMNADDEPLSSPVCYAHEVHPVYMGLAPCNALSEFAPRVWLAEGPTVSFHGFPYSTRMAVVRLSDGKLFIWSPTALTPALKDAVDALGPVSYVVTPNALHHLFLAEWRRAYPDACIYAPPGLRRKCKDIAFSGDLGDAPESAWDRDIDQVVVRGSFALTEVVFFHRPSGTAIFGDLIQNFPRDWFRGWRGIVARFGGIVAPHPSAPRDWRASFLRRRPARAALDHILAWPIERVIIAHGDCATHDGRAFVRRAFVWLIGRR